jgi:D-alanyl-lipoteichoic acid acyltransferase DltB (MBOAT superfamily)
MKLVKTLVATFSYLTVTASSTLAVGINNPASNITTANGVGDLFRIVFLFLIGIVGGLAIIFIIIGGIRYILAGGNEKATAAAKNQITAALIGLVIALLAVVIVVIVGTILGTPGGLLNNPTPSPTGV